MGGNSSKPAAPIILENPWRQIDFRNNTANKQYVENYTPQAEGQQLRILLHGPLGAGKSSFINSVKTVLQNRICRQAMVANISQDSCTREYKTYRIQKGDLNTFCSFVLNDMMGLKYITRRNRKIHVKDVKRALKGQIKDGYTFNPECKLSKGDRYFNRNPTENDKVHVLVCVVDASTVSMIKDHTLEAIQDVRDEASELGIPQVAIFTQIDKAFPEIQKDVKNVYKSKSLQEKMEKFSADVGIPINCIFPVKNYHSETISNPDVDAVILNALRHIITIGDEFLSSRNPPQ